MSTPAPTYTRTTVSQNDDRRVVQYTFTDGRVVRETLSYRTGRLAYSLDGQRLPGKAAMDLLTSHVETTEGHAAPADSTPSMPDAPAYQVTTWGQQSVMAQVLEQLLLCSRAVVKLSRQARADLDAVGDALTHCRGVLGSRSSFQDLADAVTAREHALATARLMFGESSHLALAASGDGGCMRLYASWATHRLGWES